MTFGLGFITVLFLAFLSGFMMARKLLEWDFIDSMFMSLFVGISTLFIEMILMMFRIDKFATIQDRERKRLKLE